MLTSVTVNWWAILVAGVINMVLGWLWYSPMVFGKMWMEAMGIKEMKPKPANLLGMFIVALVIAWALAYFVSYAKADTFSLGLQVGVLASIGFFALPMASGTFAGGSSWRMWAINSGYWLVSLAIIGGMLATWH